MLDRAGLVEAVVQGGDLAAATCCASVARRPQEPSQSRQRLAEQQERRGGQDGVGCLHDSVALAECVSLAVMSAFRFECEDASVAPPAMALSRTRHRRANVKCDFHYVMFSLPRSTKALTPPPRTHPTPRRPLAQGPAAPANAALPSKTTAPRTRRRPSAPDPPV